MHFGRAIGRRCSWRSGNTGGRHTFASSGNGGISHLSGPIGIIDNFVAVSRAGLPLALWFTILVNVNLAIFNLLPLPVLDGGQMLFATITKLRGRALPVNFIAAAQSVFLVLLLSMVAYVTLFSDVPRIFRESRAAERAAAERADHPGGDACQRRRRTVPVGRPPHERGRKFLALPGHAHADAH